jgi:hypothetical protein
MLFLMLVCQDSVPVPAPSAPAGGDVEQWVTTMDGRGVRVTGDALAPDAEALAVRVREDQLQVTEGAFLDTKGALLGFDVLECKTWPTPFRWHLRIRSLGVACLRSGPHLPISQLHRDQPGIGPLVYLSRLLSRSWSLAGHVSAALEAWSLSALEK